MLVNFRYRFVFVHIPETGGSSIERALRDAFPEPRGRLYRLGSALGLPRCRQHRAAARHTRHETYAEFLDNFTGRTGLPRSAALGLRPVVFVRHPVSRFISLHRFLLKKHRERYPDVPEDIDAWAETVRDGTAPYLARIRSLRTQVSYVRGIDGDHFLGRFETIGTDADRLGTYLGAPLRLDHLNASGARPAARDDWRVLSDRSLDFLSTTYAEDFAHFGYGLN